MTRLVQRAAHPDGHDDLAALREAFEAFAAAEEERHKALLDTLARHDKALYGNGRPGLLETVARLKGGLALLAVLGPVASTVAAAVVLKGMGI